MAITATLAFQGKNRLRYHLVQDGNAGTSVDITTTGAASPDLRTDSIAGPIKALARACADGFGRYAAGALTVDQARALWLSALFGVNDPSDTDGTPPTAMCRLTANVGAHPWSVVVGVDGDGNPVLSVHGPAGASSAFLDIEIPGALGA